MSQEDRKTNVPDFLSELDAGVLKIKSLLF
ncbi:prophage protein [Proteus mirabilis]|nr:prophage protein [Proteus mirabilis]